MHRQKPPGRHTAWTLIVPVKPLVRAKSRLAATAGEALRPELALAFAQDTVRAALSCPSVHGVVVVTDDRSVATALSVLGARVVPDAPPGGGEGGPGPLNAALAHGAATVREECPETAVATLNADLPALRPEELTRVLSAARNYPRAFLPDADGIGTTFLSARPGAELAPDFGGGSRAKHRASGAVEIALPGVDSVRRDVDTGADLQAALTLGVGPATARCCAAASAWLR